MKELTKEDLMNVNGGNSSAERIEYYNRAFNPRGVNNVRIDRNSAHKHGGSRVGGYYIID